MPMNINSLGHALHGVTVPAIKTTPPPEKSKVVGKPVRSPVNRQTAMVIRPNKDWLTQPMPPEKPPAPRQAEIDELTAKLKAEHNAHALTRDRLGAARQALVLVKDRVAALEAAVEVLRRQAAEKDETIRQLEELTL